MTLDIMQPPMSAKSFVSTSLRYVVLLESGQSDEEQSDEEEDNDSIDASSSSDTMVVDYGTDGLLLWNINSDLSET
jgi:hypothetical protein